MVEKRLLLALVFITLSVSAQIKGIVKDSLSGKPIPFVNIWVQNENIGSTSEENGTFFINTIANGNKLIFSTLGFEKKIIKASDASVVYLKPAAYLLNEVVISKSIGTRETEIGKTKTEIYQAFDNGPKIDTKFFPYLQSYKKTKYLKKVSIYSDSRIENASIKIHFYNVDSKGYPAEELTDKDFVVSVKKGTRTNWFDLTKFNLKFPKNGLFVGFEKLMIERNKTEKSITDSNTNITQIQRTYFPFVLYNYVERDYLYTFSGGKWSRQPNQEASGTKGKMMINEPVITLILSN
ncbi:carboxypeptidase-like regulatory domain-containing protein [Flavobacterium franklandianum]|uniref:Carboxypeptidase-like regulatory domain-containing protein n=1 Tax=Flavobacterium franklandianum TaxID=2594430 RepID=A0A553CTB2_9FLAO|nr:carboxypeptidase-like regulatory domain-containing protein [Flavobacterium franklandianum]TRX23737.1 carboxypeptidase-like regulatory domain-containing protein [Flavobacterium franklandianum]TRX26961.1 carboxypeptidase-like regulatory domain-containing protein [Flavobacterium franklandianum]